MTDFLTSIESIPSAIESKELTITHIKFSFLIGIGAFLLLIPFYRSRKSFFDAIAARNVMRTVRLFVFAQFLSTGFFFYFYFALGSPINLHAQWGYGNGDSWLYGFGRPTASLVFICVLGAICDMHPYVRWFVLIACGVEIVGDALSACQVRDYYRQMRNNAAPMSKYSLDDMIYYYCRDIISIGLCTTILFLVAFLTCIVGWVPPQLIHPSLIYGFEMDRYDVMRQQRERRSEMVQRGLLGDIPKPQKFKPTIKAMLSNADKNNSASNNENNADDDEHKLDGDVNGDDDEDEEKSNHEDEQQYDEEQGLLHNQPNSSQRKHSHSSSNNKNNSSSSEKEDVVSVLHAQQQFDSLTDNGNNNNNNSTKDHNNNNNNSNKNAFIAINNDSSNSHKNNAYNNNSNINDEDEDLEPLL